MTRACRFRLAADGGLVALARERLELSAADPAQVAFSPDGATPVVSERGTDPDVVRKSSGGMTHVSDDERYSSLNDRVCAIARAVQRRPHDPASMWYSRSPISLGKPLAA